MLKTIIVATLIAILSGMGIGSGGFLVIYLTQIASTPQIAAQGINLIFFIFSATASSLFNLKRHRILWKTVLIISLSGSVGCLLGALLAGAIGGEALQKIFGVMLILSGFLSLFKMIFSKKSDI